MQNNYFAYSNNSQRYHPYASQSYPINYHVPEDGGADFSSDVYLGGGGENNNVPYRHAEGRNNRFNNRRFQGRGRFGHRGRGNHHQQQQSQHKVWMTDEILEAIRERNELQRKAEESRNPDDWSIFKAVRNRTNLMINDARRLYEMSLPQAETTVLQGQGTRAKPVCAFYCDTCDRSFANDNLLQEHNAEHVVCQLDGCKFTAHPKIILKHIEMQHSNNLFFRVKGFETAEEIEKWKMERRSKFPTADNIRKREEEITERNKRGERLPLRNNDKGKKNLGSGEDLSRPDRPNRSQPYERRNKNNAHAGLRKNSYAEKQASQDPEAKNDKETLVRPTKPAFTFGSENLPSDSSKRSKSEVLVLESFYALIKVGENGALVGKKMMPWNNETQVLCQKIARTGKPLKYADEEGSQNSDEGEEEDEANFITDEEDVSRDTVPPVVKKDAKPLEIEIIETKPTLAKEEKSSGLGLVAYSSDSDGEAPEELPTDSCREEGEIAEGKVISTDTVTILAKNATDLRSTVNTEKSTAREGQGSTSKPNNLKQILKNLPPVGAAKNAGVFKKRHPRVPRLLKKLLENDIRQERNYILQVCRFIIENNFFEGSPVSRNEIDMVTKNEANEPKQEANVTTSPSSEQIVDLSQSARGDETPVQEEVKKMESIADSVLVVHTEGDRNDSLPENIVDSSQCALEEPKS